MGGDITSNRGYTFSIALMIWILSEMMESTELVLCLVFHPVVNFHFKIQDPESIRMCLSQRVSPATGFRTLKWSEQLDAHFIK